MNHAIGSLLLGAMLLAPLTSFAKVQGEGGPIADVTLEQARVERAHRAEDFARFCLTHGQPADACQDAGAARTAQ
ncbi:hypothetical protein [Paraburkholderia sp.]|uniref:hypothetical protein n=1 Tax=Paraburkholderia sp. TaxID=1926495 RepID=UPI003D6E4531